MSSPYRRRKPSLIRNFWIYRYVIAAAFVLGVLLWFIATNSAPVQVVFPFGLGTIASTAGLTLLLGAVAGSLLTLLALGVVFGLRRLKARPASSELEKEAGVFDDDLPPSDYAANAPEGFDDAPWAQGR